MSNVISTVEISDVAQLIAVESEGKEFAALSLAQFLTHEIIPQNPDGFTFCAVTRSLRSFPQNVFTVSLSGYGCAFPFVSGEADVHEWVCSHFESFCRYGHFVGGFYDFEASEFYLDLSIAVVGLERARGIARKNQQKSIYHSATGEIIPVREN